jgi:hypothetical protein
MSNKNTRRIARLYHTEAKNTGKAVELKFHGINTTKTDATAVVSVDWNIWPYIVREVGKAWKDERASRLRDIASIDKSLPVSDSA